MGNQHSGRTYCHDYCIPPYETTDPAEMTPDSKRKRESDPTMLVGNKKPKLLDIENHDKQ